MDKKPASYPGTISGGVLRRGSFPQGELTLGKGLKLGKADEPPDLLNEIMKK
jgi:hypothetical protein